VAVRDGTVAGFDLDRIAARLVRPAKPKELVDFVAKSMASGQSSFDRLAGSFRIEQGIVRSDDLTLTAQTADLTGAGSADLPNRTLDLLLTIKLAADPELPPYRLSLTGPLDRPRRTLDTEGLAAHLEQRASEEIRRKAAQADRQTDQSQE